MRLLLPDSIVVEPLVSVLEAEGVSMGRGPAYEALDVLLKGGADVALVPTLTVLRHLSDVDVLPGVALSMWDYPFARIVLRQGLDTPAKTLAVDPAAAQEAFLAHLLLSEHYGFTPQIVPVTRPDLGALDAYDAVLLTGDAVPLTATDHVALDIGQEWYELTNYPLPWGLFVTRKDAAIPPWRRALLDAVQTWEEQQALWLRAREMPEVLHSFFAEHLRFRFDDLAIAALTELRDYLFQRGALDEVADLPIADLPDEEGDEDRDPLL